MLRAQVDRLNTELREYKRRLQTSELTRSTALGIGNLPGFQFDFPPFGPSTATFPKNTVGHVAKDAPKPVESHRPSSSISSSSGVPTGSSLLPKPRVCYPHH